MSQAKHWMFTLNNPSVESDHVIRALPYKYLIYSYEMGTSGTVHIQGYVSFSSAKKLAFMTKHLPGAHFEIRRGSHEQAKAYCSKTDDVSFLDGPYEFGDDSEIPSKSGARIDLLTLKKDLDANKSLKEIADNHFGTYLRYERGIKSYLALSLKHRDYTVGQDKPIIKIYWGPSGTGKTRRALQEYPNCYQLTKPSTKNTEVWWQRYAGEEVVLFDEFYGWIDYALLIRILDFSKVEVPIKGDSMPLRAKTFIFTSNQNPDKWYKGIKDRQALDRRLREFGTIEYMGTIQSEDNFASPVEQGYISEEL